MTHSPIQLTLLQMMTSFVKFASPMASDCPGSSRPFLTRSDIVTSLEQLRVAGQARPKINENSHKNVLPICFDFYSHFHRLLSFTLPKNDLLSHLNWGAQVLMEQIIDCCISLKMIPKKLVVLGVVDMRQFLLRRISWMIKAQPKIQNLNGFLLLT